MSGQELHEDLARLRVGHRGILCRRLVRPQVRAVEEHDAASNTSRRHEAEQGLSDAGTGPADDPKGRASEHLRGAPPEPFWSRQRMPESVRLRSYGGVSALRRHATTRGSGSNHCASFSIDPPASGETERKTSQSV